MYEIRHAELTDLVAIKELNTKAFSNNPKWDADAIRNWASTKQGDKYYREALTDPKGCFLVCEDEGELIGYANGTDAEITYRKSRYFEVVNIGVVPERRREGIANALLTQICEWAKSQGYERIYLDSYIKNRSALNFYKMNGFKEISVGLERDL